MLCLNIDSINTGTSQKRERVLAHMVEMRAKDSHSIIELKYKATYRLKNEESTQTTCSKTWNGLL